MHLVEIFLPVERDGDRSVIERTLAELTERFGGATAFSRSPAEGLWKDGGEVERDRIVIVEVMVSDLDHAWWRSYRERLEAELRQDVILIRATVCDRF